MGYFSPPYLEAFVVDPPFLVKELKASLNEETECLVKGTHYYGYQKDVWGQCLRKQAMQEEITLNPAQQKVIAVPRMVHSADPDRPALLRRREIGQI